MHECSRLSKTFTWYAGQADANARQRRSTGSTTEQTSRRSHHFNRSGHTKGVH